MNLRQKSLTIIGVTLLCVVAIVPLATRSILLDNYLWLEREQVSLRVQAARGGLAGIQRSLERTARDWSSWDDIYRFVADGNEDFRRLNLTPAAIANLDVDFLVVADRRGNPVFGSAFQAVTGLPGPLPPWLPPLVAPGGMLDRAATEHGASGVIDPGGVPCVVAAEPILTSLGQGPARGTLVMVRLLDAGRVAGLTEASGGRLTFLAPNDPALPPDVTDPRGSGTAVVPSDGDLVAGFTPLADPAGRRSVFLRIEMPRQIYRQGVDTVRTFMFALAVLGGVAVALSLIFLNRMVLARLQRLTRSVAEVRAEADFSRRVAVSGNDEVAILAGEINAMLGSLGRIHRELRQSEERFRSIVQASPMGAHLYELDGEERVILIDANPAADRITGIETATLFGKPIEEAFPGLAATEFPERYRAAAREGTPWQTSTFQYEDERITGAYDVYAFGTSPGRMAVMFLDVGERMLYEEQLRNGEERLRITLDAIGDAVLATDACGCITRLNPVAERLSGWTAGEAQGRPLAEVLTLLDGTTRLPLPNPVEIVLAGETSVGLPAGAILRARGGGERLVADSVAPIRDANGRTVGVVLVLRDVTEKQGLEDRLRQAQKMEAIGQLAGGVAHDFNNMLGGIIGAAELLMLRTEGDPEARGHVRSIIETGVRAADLTRKLLTFSRKGRLVATPVDLHAVIGDALTILGRSIDRRITLRSNLAARSAMIFGDAAQLQNAVLNLGLNARDAMPEGGVLTIATRTILLDASPRPAGTDELPPGEYLQVSVTDTGIGMPREIREHLFEPFFTTKDVGRGTGLGLAAVYGSVKDHHGAVAVETEEGKGSAFHLFLPVRMAGADAEEAPVSPARGSGTILLVDDEDSIRDTTRLMLESLGYEVLAVENGERGVAVFREHPEVDLVLMDMVMPVMNGREAFHAMRAIRPDVRVLFASGFLRELGMAELLETGSAGFLQKPYRRHDLGRAVEAALGGAAPGKKRSGIPPVAP